MSISPACFLRFHCSQICLFSALSGCCEYLVGLEDADVGIALHVAISYLHKIGIGCLGLELVADNDLAPVHPGFHIVIIDPLNIYVVPPDQLLCIGFGG